VSIVLHPPAANRGITDDESVGERRPLPLFAWSAPDQTIEPDQGIGTASAIGPTASASCC
jgi:hypothetical protein